jgi:hypothetical protein
MVERTIQVALLWGNFRGTPNGFLILRQCLPNPIIVQGCSPVFRHRTIKPHSTILRDDGVRRRDTSSMCCVVLSQGVERNGFSWAAADHKDIKS